MNIYDLPPDFPNYQQVAVGDIFVWYVGHEDKVDANGVKQVHGHWFQVMYKDKRYAQVDVKTLRCDHPNGTCDAEIGETQTIGWSKLEYWQTKTRWLRNPGAKVLFGASGGQK